MKISWISPEDLLDYEFRQAEDEGKNVSARRELWEKINASSATLPDVRRFAVAMLHELAALPVSDELQRHEPSALEMIRAVRSSSSLSAAVQPQEMLYDKILGGWLGRAAGCLLGKPVEKISRQGIKEILQSNGRWPLVDFITASDMPQTVLEKYPWNRHYGKESLKENIVCMTEDDDMNYPMLNLRILETHGKTFGTEDLATAWLENLPVLSTFTAERVAYINLLSALEPPVTATHRNPYREWIGAQIRADVWGWVSPGRPTQAAELAWRDARLSHVRNGIYGEMFVAAMVAAAFVTSNIEQIVESGLGEIPPESRLAKAVRFAIKSASTGKSWEDVLDRLYENFGHYHWVHTINNAALVAAALLHGQGDYERTICAVVMGGWDTDSNGATVGSIIGTMHGAGKLPAKWITPLNNRLRSSMKGFDNATFDDLAKRTVAQVS